MNRNLRIEVCEEFKYAVPCLTPEYKGAFLLNGNEVKSKESTKLRKEACAQCLVRLECLTDAINDALDIGYLSRTVISGFAGGKTPAQQASIARDFKAEGYERVNLEQVDAHPLTYSVK